MGSEMCIRDRAGMSLLLIGPWPIGLPVLVAGMAELFVVLLS